MSKLEEQKALPRRKLFRSTEDFVRQVLTKDLKQMASDETIRSVAIKVNRAMPKRKAKQAKGKR